MKRNWIVVTLAASLLVVVSILVFYLHYEGIQEVRSQFERHQLSYAKHLSHQIQSYIEGRSRALRALSAFPSLQYGGVKQQEVDIESSAIRMEKVYVRMISLYNEQGTVVYCTDPMMIGSKSGESPMFLWAKSSENKDRIFLRPVVSNVESDSLIFTLAVPLYQQAVGRKQPKLKARFAGVLAYTLDMKKFLVDQLGSVDPKLGLDQVWIIDKDGTLLFQPDHPEMVSRNIYQQEGSCGSCHISFGYIEEILAKKQGTVDYSIKKHPKKIAAFISMEFEDISWFVVVNSSYDKVTGFIRKSLREHLVLLGIAVFAFAVGSIMFVRNERMKIKAENEVILWQEKMAERKKAEEALELERNKLKGILDSMNDGVYIVNQECEVLYANPALERACGPVSKAKCYKYILNLREICTWCKREEVFAGKTVLWEWHSSKTGKTYEIFDTPLTGPDGALCKLGIIRDITDRKEAERQLRESEERYRMLVETMNDGLGVQNENGKWVYVNDRLCEMLGYGRDELVGRAVFDFLDEAGRSVYQDQASKNRNGKVEPYELSWLKKDGQKISTLVSPKSILDDREQFKGSFAVITSITERKQAEEALKESERQLRYLSRQLISAQETERKRISRELHDELGQSLTVMKLRLGFIERKLLGEQTEVRQECESGVQYLNQVIEDIRRLSRDLSPTILEDFGLSAALRWLVNNFAKSYNIKVILDMIEIDALLPRDSHIVVYRTVQEALTNIGKHSRAKHVSISIHEEKDTVRFSIEDDGIGFDEGKITARSPEEKGLGLATMSGRARMAGGALHIWTKEGEGTLITFRLPKKQG